jgi:hypothetical protein
MGSRELIESLRRAGEENIRCIKRDAEQKAEAKQASLATKIAELRRRYADELAAPKTRNPDELVRRQAAGASDQTCRGKDALGPPVLDCPCVAFTVEA